MDSQTTAIAERERERVMEAVLIRIDLLRDRKQYTSILKTWLQELEITHGRLMTMGDVHLLFIAAREAQISKLLEYYATKEIDTNSQDEVCTNGSRRGTMLIRLRFCCCSLRLLLFVCFAALCGQIYRYSWKEADRGLWVQGVSGNEHLGTSRFCAQ